MNSILKRWNWGWGIGLLYTCFVFFMLGMVYKASQQSVELVTTDYYKQELDYQTHIDKLNRTATLSKQLQWHVKEDAVLLSFPVGGTGNVVKADVFFYRPSDSGKDLTVSIVADSTGMAIVHSDKLVPGIYRMQVDWQDGATAYYNEGIVNLN